MKDCCIYDKETNYMPAENEFDRLRAEGRLQETTYMLCTLLALESSFMVYLGQILFA